MTFSPISLLLLSHLQYIFFKESRIISQKIKSDHITLGEKNLQQLIIKLKIKFNLLILAYKFHSLHDLHPPASQIYPMPPSPLPTLLWPHKYTKILPIKEFSYTI